MVPHKLESRNQFVKSLREAFEHTLKEVSTISIFASPSTSLGTNLEAARNYLTLEDIHSRGFVLNSPVLTWRDGREGSFALTAKDLISTAFQI